MKIVHVIPELSVADGVGNYGTVLSDALRACPGVTSETMAYHNSLWSTISPDCQVLVVHWSPYGYSQRGVPFRMVRSIERWLDEHPSARLMVMFHELFARGAPWRSSFWLSPLQKRLTRRLLRRCDCAVTTASPYEATLRTWRPDAPLKRVAVFSTVGEPPSVLPPTNRSNVGVIFGRAGVDDWIYRRLYSDLAEKVERHKIQMLIDVGPRRGRVPNKVGNVPVKRMGVLPAEAVSRVLLQARYGFLAYPPIGLDKSTTFAAYAAHGVLPMILWPEGDYRSADPNRVGLLKGAVNSHNPNEWVSTQAQLMTWYCRHSVRKQASLWRNWASELIQSGPGVSKEALLNSDGSAD